jgi:glucose-6-phosphate 1-dehydrogenase
MPEQPTTPVCHGSAKRSEPAPEAIYRPTSVGSEQEARVSDEPAGRPGDPCVMVSFGASGDLTKRKLIPALYNQAKDNLLSRQFAVVGSARRPMTHESFREKLTEDMKEFATGPVDPDLWEWFVRRLYYLPGDGQDPETAQRLQELLTQIDKEHGTPGNYFYYLATAPGLFAGVISQLGLAGPTHEADGRWRRVIIEKPFGHDYASARTLNHDIRQVLEERQIYRMEFRYADYFGSTPSTGYERLLYDCMTGDATLFQRADMVEASWGVVAPILDVWKALPPRNFPNYAAGTWGPKEADELLGRDGRQWRRING